MDASYIPLSLIFVLIPILVIAGVVYLIVRARRPRPTGITSYQVLLAYFYTLSAASFFTMVVGLVYFFIVALSPAFNGRDTAGDLTQASVLLGTGAIIYILHIYGRRIVEKREQKATLTLRRIYLFFMLAAFSIVGLISLPLAINETVRYFVVETKHHLPRGQIALAIVFVPLWAYFMFSVFRELRQRNDGTETEVETIEDA